MGSKITFPLLHCIYSLVETTQDPFCFAVLEAARLLVWKGGVPKESWDFILCNLFTLIQVGTK